MIDGQERSVTYSSLTAALAGAEGADAKLAAEQKSNSTQQSGECSRLSSCCC
jgi:hypothetical protein